MLNYERLSKELQNRINEEIFGGRGFDDPAVRRENREHDKATLWRGAYVRDAEKIMHSPYYNRYADKTQVFSFYKNDDISHRALHVQLVSRVARNIGVLLAKPAYQSRNSKFIVQTSRTRKEVLRDEQLEAADGKEEPKGGSLF